MPLFYDEQRENSDILQDWPARDVSQTNATGDLRRRRNLANRANNFTRRERLLYLLYTARISYTFYILNIKQYTLAFSW